MNLDHIKKTFIKSQGNSGLACLQSIFGYYDRRILNSHFHLLDKNDIYDCSSFLKLHDAAKIIGLDTACYEADITDFRKLDNPLILMINSEEDFQHFIICYGYDGRYLIGDPLWGLIQYREEELQSIWKSNVVMLLTPGSECLSKKEEVKFKRNIINQFFNQHKSNLLKIFLFGALSVLLTFSSLLLIRRLFDLGLDNNFVTYPLWPVVSSVFSFFFIFTYFFHRIASKLITQITKDILHTTNVFFIKQLDKSLVTPSEILAEIEAIILNYHKGNNLIVALFYYIPVVVITITASVFIEYHVFFILLLALIVYFLSYRRYYKTIALEQNKKIAQDKILTIDILNIFANRRLMKLSTGPSFDHRITEITSNFFRSSLTNDNLKGNVYFLSILIGVFTITCVIFFLKHTITYNESKAITIVMITLVFVVFVTLSISSLFGLNKLINIFKHFMDYSFYKENIDTLDNENVNIERVQAKDVSIRYPGYSEILQEISFELEIGKTFAFFGANGTGKTTLLEALSRTINIESGTVTINGNPWEEINKNLWVKFIASVSQNSRFINGTVIDNICFDSYQPEVNQIINFCEILGFAPFFYKLPKGFFTVIDEDFTFVSKGTLQLILFARALYRKPKLLLLDEPFVNMDEKAKNFTMSLIQNIKQQMIIVLATADIHVAQKSDFLYVIDQSKVMSGIFQIKL